jgi:DNA-damage-inducible protein J
MSSTLTVRLDEDLKREFLKVVSEVGLDAPAVIRMLAVQTVRQRRIPLSLSADTDGTMAFLDSVRADWGEW